MPCNSSFSYNTEKSQIRVGLIEIKNSMFCTMYENLFLSNKLRRMQYQVSGPNDDLALIRVSDGSADKVNHMDYFNFAWPSLS